MGNLSDTLSQTELGEALASLFSSYDSLWTKPVPEVLYHYTDARGLIGILESGKIRLTHSSFLNDFSELVHGWDIAVNLFKDKLEQYKQFKNVRVFLESVIAVGNPLEKNVESFVASFCQKDDLLNQWRGYGSSDGAFSIGIETKSLPILKNLNEVVYDEVEQKRRIENFLEGLIQLVKKYGIDFGGKDIEKLTEVMSHFYAGISRALIYFKNEAFATEHEWRYHEGFFKDKDEVYAETEFREAGGIIVPYRGIELHSDTASRLPLRSITYALSKDSSLTRKSIELLLRKFGYDPSHIEVTESKVPLRFK